MGWFIAQRIVHAIFAMFVITVVIFGTVRLSGDPARMMISDEAPHEQYLEMRRLLLLDRPIPEQYWRWVSQAAQGDFGISLRYQIPVSELVSTRLPATLELACAAYGFTRLMGLTIGGYSAAFRGSVLDAAARLLAVMGQAAPNFWMGIMLVLVFAVWLNWLPSGGRGEWRHLVLPAITLGWAPVAGLMRITRSSMIEVLSSDYVRLARVKGVGETSVLWKHAFKNGALPILTFASLVFLGLIRGSVIVETVFFWPGIGLLVLEGVNNRDFQVVQAIVLLFSSWVVFGNLIVDILYVYLNPKIKH